MGIFEQFPYSNFHNANLDNVLNNSNQALRDAANAVHIAGEAKDIAEGLTDDVTTALQEAEAASTAAASAEATAAQAQAEAAAVSGLAQDAYDTASAADSAAANALSVANTASSNASAAVATANTANTTANAAEDLATQAAADASAALSGLISLRYIDRSFSNLVIPSNHYVLIGDCVTDFGMPANATPLSFFIRGWSGINAPITLVLGSNGTSIFAIGTASQSLSRIYIRLWYIE